MQRIRSIIHEIHRRSLWQVLGIYLVGSWLGYQVIHSLTDGLGLPDWVPGFAVVLFFIGLPIVLATAFVQEGPPTRSDVSGRAPAAPSATAAGDEGSITAAETGAGAATTPSEGRTPPASSDPWLTWRRSIAAGITAFLLLGLTAGGYMGARNAGIGPFGSLVASGKVADQERILIADFNPGAADTALANVVTEAFRIDFARSSQVRAVEPAAVRDALRRMERTDAVRLDDELAFEMARRDGINVVLTGEVSPAGGGHVLSARLIATGTGEVLAAVRESAGNSQDLLPAIDRLSRSLRERLGESLRTIRRSEPLAQVTTSSLAALEKYTQSRRATGWDGDPDRGFALLREAVALDTAFAAAHYGLGIHYSNRYQPELALAALERALSYQDRLSDAMRHNARSTMHSVRREYAQAAVELERSLAIEPGNYAALNNVALLYSAMRQHDRAEEYYRRAIATDTARYFAWANLGETYMHQGRIDDAIQAFAQSAALAPESGWPVVNGATAPALFGRHAEAEANLRAITDDPSRTLGTRGWATQNLTLVLGAVGRYAEADRLTEQVAAVTGDTDAARRRIAGNRLWREVMLHDRPERARQWLPQYRAQVERDAAADSAIWLDLASLCGWMEDLACARDALNRSGRDGAPPPWASVEMLLAHAATAFAAGNYDAAISHLRAIRHRSCLNCEETWVGRVFERMARPDSAIAAYERYLASTAGDRVWVDDIELARTHRRLGELYEERQQLESAAMHYARFVELWTAADADLQPYVAAVRERITRLQPDRR
jgi:eukaryotic-like serine/threonine-protein kinase